MAIEIKFKKLHPDAIIPSYAHEDDAAMDLHSVEDYTIVTGEKKLVKTGLSVEVPVGYEMQIRPRSGLALKQGITVLNSPGTLDAGYRGEIGVILINHGNEDYEISKGERIAQAKISKVEKVVITESEKLSESDRGENGFGSTGSR